MLAGDRAASRSRQLVVAFNSIAAAKLRGVKRVIGRFQQRKRARKALVGRIRRDTDRRGDVNASRTLDGVIGTRQGREDSLRDLASDSTVGARQYDDEFLATESRDQIAASDHGLNRLRAAVQDLVADRSALHFVDQLEAVEIDMRDAQVTAEHHGLRELAVEHAIEPGPVEHAGQWVAAAGVLGFFRTRQ